VSIYSTGASKEELNGSAPRLRKFMTLRQVIEATGLSTSFIYEQMKKGLFPRQVHLSDTNDPLKKLARWIEDEVAEYQAQRIAVRDARPLKPPRVLKPKAAPPTP
jgi:predicted DNA-binding transcriptional regulator AlpA